MLYSPDREGVVTLACLLWRFLVDMNPNNYGLTHIKPFLVPIAVGRGQHRRGPAARAPGERHRGLSRLRPTPATLSIAYFATVYNE